MVRYALQCGITDISGRHFSFLHYIHSLTDLLYCLFSFTSYFSYFVKWDLDQQMKKWLGYDQYTVNERNNMYVCISEWVCEWWRERACVNERSSSKRKCSVYQEKKKPVRNLAVITVCLPKRNIIVWLHRHTLSSSCKLTYCYSFDDSDDCDHFLQIKLGLISL